MIKPEFSTIPDSQTLIEHMPMVYSEARRLSLGLPSSVEMEELAGFGFIGLLEAAQRFDPAKGIPFGAFARFRVRGAMIDGLRGVLGLTRRRAYERFKRRILADKAPESNGGQSSQLTNAEVTFGEIMQLAAGFLMLTDGSLQPDNHQLFEKREDLCRLRDALAQLTSTEQAVIRAVYDLEDEGDSGAALARRMGINRSGISRRHRAALARLRDILSTCPAASCPKGSPHFDDE